MNGARSGPVSPCMDTEHMNHRITKKALKALVDHAGDESRESIHCIFASTDGSVLVATDGTALLLRHDPQAGEGGMLPAETLRKGRTLSLNACKRAIKLCSAKGRMEINAADAVITVWEPHDASSVQIDASRAGREPSWARNSQQDGFPPYPQVIPNIGLRSDGPPSMNMPPALMARMFSALMPRHVKGSAVRLGFRADRDPVRVDVEPDTPGIVDDCAWIGVLMPIFRA